MSTHYEEKVEILSVDLLDQNRALVEELKTLSSSLGIDLGWHYLLDLSWILSQVKALPGMHVMDAGAGTGVMQWYLAGKGVNVLSVDRSEREDLPLRFRANYSVEGKRPGDLLPAGQVFSKHLAQATGLTQKAKGLARDSWWMVASGFMRKASGTITLYNQDLSTLKDIPSDSLDLVVAVSSLEHNQPENLEKVVIELLRVLKKGGAILATLGAGRDQDWFHEPSQGWCYSADTLKRLFHLPPTTPSNEAQYDELFNKLVNCSELRDHLAKFYFASGDNGMPWGKWDPQYQSVGVCKVKS